MKINDATPPATTTYPGMIEIATDAEAAAETATDKALVPSNIPSMSVTPDAHNTSHQNGGSDEISVAGLSGLLADDQHVLDAEVQAISINSVVEDTTPQLGGTLDCNGNAIGGTTPGTGTFTTLKGQTLEGEHSAPTLTLHNTSHEDTDYGRESEIRFKGEQSGGEETTLAIIQAAHDGTSDDQKGILTIKVNGGSDGDAPTDVLTIDSEGKVGIGTNAVNPAGCFHTYSAADSATPRRVIGGGHLDGTNITLHGSEITGYQITTSGSSITIGSAPYVSGIADSKLSGILEVTYVDQSDSNRCGYYLFRVGYTGNTSVTTVLSDMQNSSCTCTKPNDGSVQSIVITPTTTGSNNVKVMYRWFGIQGA